MIVVERVVLVDIAEPEANLFRDVVLAGRVVGPDIVALALRERLVGEGATPSEIDPRLRRRLESLGYLEEEAAPSAAARAARRAESSSGDENGSRDGEG